MAKQPEPILDIDLGANGGRKVFRSLEEVETWLHGEQSFWSWVGKVDDPAIKNIWSQLNQQWNDIRPRINQAKPHTNDPNFSDLMRNIQAAIERSYSANKCLMSSTPRAKRIEELKTERNDVVAGYALAYFMDMGIWQNKSESAEGAFEALLFDRGMRKSAVPEKRALDELRQEFTEVLEDHKTRVNTLETEFADLTTKANDQLTKQDGVFSTALEQGNQELKDIARAYDDKMALQAPVEYWEGRSETHADSARRFGQYVITAGIVGFGIVGILAWVMIAQKALDYSRLALFFVLAAFVILGLRILVRILLSNLHLETDARERVVMVKTYLSLLREGKGLGDDDRALILSALFRPATTGIVKEEAVPQSLMERFSQFLSGKSS